MERHGRQGLASNKKKSTGKLPVSLTQDFTRLKSLSRDDQQKRLRELAARGEVITATYAARQLYGGSLAEAKQTVNSLPSDQVPQ